MMAWLSWRMRRPHPSQFYIKAEDGQWYFDRMLFNDAMWKWKLRRPRRKVEL